MARRTIKLTEASYQIISSLLDEALEDLEKDELENTVGYERLEKAKEEIEGY